MNVHFTQQTGLQLVSVAPVPSVTLIILVCLRGGLRGH
ncbi:hypothetical protein R69927_04019 [Paraburkholderia domus]|uniref:Uncharacterized protein n=1 Tax=Paraburkholderia domus TaxID=2793075 RepID=A0A9N8MR91_9BURK|nr:hypothetical protein R70006_04229 [Paraburkholderia domus]CAE6782869.1 hypothetical protein R75483_04525 [Paraburkholderia domus]CAE6877584.1 hypothetical protein R69927_04019 [Paraburkholderia domus]CAE6890238.1 hypothetical protein R70211_02665 [Paraburkholderia domus]CAE6892725.1 hypothetical protein R75471_02478 [Paraburkholderia domus]